jgi:hypothetical protein
MLNIQTDKSVSVLSVIKWVSGWIIVLPAFLYYMKYLIMDQMELKFSDSSQIFSGKLGELWVISIVYMILSLIIMYINENKDKDYEKDLLSTVLYIAPLIIWYLLLFTLILSNVKRIIGLGSASENTINIILWGMIVFVTTQIISRNYLYQYCKEKQGDNNPMYLLHRSWIPISAITFVAILFLLFLYLSNLDRINNLFKSFIIPFIALIAIIITGIIVQYRLKTEQGVLPEEPQAPQGVTVPTVPVGTTTTTVQTTTTR